MIKIKLDKKIIDIPQSGDELTASQYQAIVKLLFFSSYDEVQRVLKAFQILAGLSNAEFFNLTPEDVEDYLYLTQFVFSSDLNVTVQLFPFVKNRFEPTLYGPSSELENLTLGEFVFTENCFAAWQEDMEDQSELDNLISILYRPVKEGYDTELDPDNDIRVPFIQNACRYNIKYIREWPLELKFAIALWYRSCRNKLVEDHEEAFGGDGEPAKYGLMSIVRTIAMKGTYGTFEDVEKQYVDLMMKELVETVLEMEAIEKQTKSRSNE